MTGSMKSIYTMNSQHFWPSQNIVFKLLTYIGEMVNPSVTLLIRQFKAICSAHFNA